MIAASLGAIVLAGVLTTFLMLGRSGANAANYSMMETQSRRALEEFSQDVRMANEVVWNSATSITLTVPDNYTSTSNLVTYAYDNDTSSANVTRQTFYRRPGTGAADAALSVANHNTRTTLVRNIGTFSFARFDRLNNTSASDATTKRIQISMVARTTTRTVASASNNVLSASFILRNKTVN